jgi:hypothetical protein
LIFVAALSITGTPHSWANDSFLLPGLSLGEADFEVGAWCRYLVVDEVMGEIDSTTVYIAVTGREETEEGEAFWIELESGPFRAPAEELETAKALISARIKNLAPGDSLCHYVKRAYIRKGTGAIESTDPTSIERLSLSSPTSDSTWTLVRDVAIDTPYGRFLCERKHLSVEDNREIPMGNVKLIKHNRDEFDIWLSDEVPIFRLVRCEIGRLRDTKTVPGIPGIPDRGGEKSRTTAELIGYGSDARPLMSIN